MALILLFLSAATPYSQTLCTISHDRGNSKTMGFVCKFQLNNGELQDTDVVTFLEYVDNSFGTYHEDQVKIAKVEFNGRETFVFSTCPCFPSGKTNLTKGQKIDKDIVIGYFATDGEDIPYGKPYARIERE